MHLIRGISTLNTSKPKFKMTKAKEASWRDDFAIYNRELKRQGQPRLAWEQYMDMRLGKTKASKPAFKPLQAAVFTHPRYVDHRDDIPSLNVVVGNTNRRENMKYDGERKLLGIAVMHKSNLVPIFDEEQAKDISRMRRG
jgi:hypothetical protein